MMVDKDGLNILSLRVSIRAEGAVIIQNNYLKMIGNITESKKKKRLTESSNKKLDEYNIRM